MEKQVGRPTVMTPEVLSKLEEAFALGCTDTEAALYADIGTRTLVEYFKNNPEFRRRTEELKETPILKARQTIIKALDNPNHAEWYLSRKLKKEFSERIENTGADGKDLPTPILAIQNVQSHLGNTKDTIDVEADQGSTRRDIGLEDNIDSSDIDKLKSERQEADPNEHSLGIISSLEKGSDEGLPSDPEGT